MSHTQLDPFPFLDSYLPRTLFRWALSGRFYRTGNWGSQRLSNLPKETQPVRVWEEIHSPICWPVMFQFPNDLQGLSSPTGRGATWQGPSSVAQRPCDSTLPNPSGLVRQGTSFSGLCEGLGPWEWWFCWGYIRRDFQGQVNLTNSASFWPPSPGQKEGTVGEAGRSQGRWAGASEGSQEEEMGARRKEGTASRGGRSTAGKVCAETCRVCCPWGLRRP